MCEYSAKTEPIFPTVTLSDTIVAYSKYTIMNSEISDNIFLIILKPLL